jgi:hypothetical protein
VSLARHAQLPTFVMLIHTSLFQLLDFLHVYLVVPSCKILAQFALAGKPPNATCSPNEGTVSVGSDLVHNLRKIPRPYVTGTLADLLGFGILAFCKTSDW